MELDDSSSVAVSGVGGQAMSNVGQGEAVAIASSSESSSDTSEDEGETAIGEWCYDKRSNKSRKIAKKWAEARAKEQARTRSVVTGGRYETFSNVEMTISQRDLGRCLETDKKGGCLKWSADQSILTKAAGYSDQDDDDDDEKFGDHITHVIAPDAMAETERWTWNNYGDSIDDIATHVCCCIVEDETICVAISEDDDDGCECGIISDDD